MKRKLPTVTLAISAFNEERNIKSFLKLAIRQKEEGFKLTSIWIFSDGSTDNTVKIAQSIKDKRIKVFDDKVRVGKSARLNEIYSKLKTDFLVQSDADVIFSDLNIVMKMVSPLIKEKIIGMCGGNPTPLKSKTWIETSVNYTCEAYHVFRHKVRGGNNIFSADGRILAYKKDLVKKISVPTNMIANDAYTYYCCLTLGYKYKFVPKAVVFYRSPQTLKDHFKQNKRFLAAPQRMSRYFKSDLIQKESYIPADILRSVFLKIFLKHPIHCLLIFVINKICLMQSKREEKLMNAKWAMATTTKNVFEKN